jgi:hypothetical protein
VLRAGILPASQRVEVRVKRVDAPLPINEAVLDGRVGIESFAWTYSALLVRRGEQFETRSRCLTAKALGWWWPAADVVDALQGVTRHVRFFLEHPSAPVAWGFATELEDLARSTRWASREAVAKAKYVSIGVGCREPECAGVYGVAVQDEKREGTDAERKREFGAKGPVAVCSLNEKHLMGARDAAR